ncbi:hypothetical protein PybrP1_008793 [[Pythium] brassicae (nom. inval.)]|nr:hypothetical protein PybrP1_008793 [[Pythium] brassicae (nom. inval.)]
MESATPIEPKRVALVLAVFLSDLLLTGLVFGWAPLLLMLQQEQQYVELCDFDSADFDAAAADADAPPLTCVAQENRLNLMFAVASVTMNAGALPIGFFLDRAGPKLAVAAAALVEVCGLLLLAFADSQDFDVFLPAYTLLAFGGSMTMMASFPASFLVMQYQTAILAAISCLFDGSSVVFLVLLSLKESFDLSRRQLLVALAAGAGALYAALVALWHVNERALREDGPEAASSPSADARHELQSLLVVAQPESEVYPSNGLPAPGPTDVAPAGPQYGSLALEAAQLARVQQRIDDEFELVDVSLGRQMRSFEFAYIVVFAAVQVLRATIYIGTTNKLLDNYGDRAADFFFTKVFSFVLPLGFLFVPAIDHIVEKRGLALSLLFTNVLGVAYNLLAFIPSLHVQCLTFFVFAGYRAFLYAVMSAFTAKTFGLKNLGSLMGIIFSIGSVVSLAEYPAVYLSNAYFDGDLTAVYGFSLLLCVLLFPYTEYLRKHEVERAQSKQALIERLTGGGKGGYTPHTPATPTHGLTYLRSPMVRKSPLTMSRFAQP